jgi:cytochrome c553
MDTIPDFVTCVNPVFYVLKSTVMRKIITILLVLLVAGFVIIQFFQPEKNSVAETSDHIFQKENIPDEIKTILKNACLDCHSNQTRYLWYHNIAPVSWLVDKDVKHGKEELNFSQWGQSDDFDKIGYLEEICKEVEQGKMPLKPYVAMHKKAKLTEEQVAKLCAWTEKLAEELVAASIKE